MKQCPDCGAELEDGALSCEWCGYSFLRQDVSMEELNAQAAEERMMMEPEEDDDDEEYGFPAEDAPGEQPEPAPVQQSAPMQQEKPLPAGNKLLPVVVAVILILALVIGACTVVFLVRHKKANAPEERIPETSPTGSLPAEEETAAQDAPAGETPEEAPALPAPVVEGVQDGVLSWQAVEGADGYELRIVTTGADGAAQERTASTRECTYTLDTAAGESVRVQVRAYQNSQAGLLNGAWSEEQESGISAETEAPAQSGTDYHAAYHQTLLKYSKKFTDDYFCGYTLFDLDGDGTKELVVTHGTCEADAVVEIWNTGHKLLGELGYGHCGLETDGTALFLNGGHMGYQWVTQIGLSGGAVTETEIYTNEQVTGDYISWGDPVQMYGLSDESALGG